MAIKINGKLYKVNGPVSIINDKILVNGEPIEDLEALEAKTIDIHIDGSVDKIKLDYCRTIEIKGDCNKIDIVNGDVEVGCDVDGDISTVNGNIECGDVSGDASTVNGKVIRK